MSPEIDIAIGTTPRTNSYERVWDWKQYVLTQIPLSGRHYRVIKRVVAMPMRPSREIAANLDAILAGTDAEFWASMEPGLTGAGDTFRGACFFAFKGRPSGSNIPVDYLLHMPIDVDYGNPHLKDVQENLVHMFTPLNTSHDEPLPDLVIGDYEPMIWNPETGDWERNPVKNGIEKHVRQQLNYYFPDNVVEKLSIQRPRSEFFMISKDLFNAVVAERRFAPWDPLPQILIFAEKKRIKVACVKLGNFYETRPAYKSASIRDQVFRTAIQISTEWLCWEHDAKMSSDQVAKQSVVWNKKTSGGIQRAFNALERLLGDQKIKVPLEK